MMKRSTKRLESHNNKLHVKKDDRVIVITGKDKGKTGRILEAYPRENRVLVEGINMVYRHTKPTKDAQQGGIVHKEAPIHVSNVMHIDPKSKKPTRVNYKIEANGKKKRIANRSGASLD
jgi:large subunit ribosomal protein L24